MKLTTSDEIDLQHSSSSDDKKYSLKIEKLRERNFGLYSCRASNDLGSSEATIEISGKFEFIIPFLADISVRKKYEIIFLKYESTFPKLSESLKLSIYKSLKLLSLVNDSYYILLFMMLLFNDII